MHFTSVKPASGLLCGLLLLTHGTNQAQDPQWDPHIAVPTPVISLDQADYQPGETARIMGSGFASNETVSLHVRHANLPPDASATGWSWSVESDANGEIQTTWHVCEDGCENSVLELTAVGQSSGLMSVVSFSDGYVSNGGFENDTLLGWSVVRSGDHRADWHRYSGTISPISFQTVTVPPEGTRAMITDHSGAGYQVLYQDLILEPGHSHLLSFKIFYHNWGNVFYTPDNLSPFGLNQQYRVDLIRPTAQILSLAAGDVLGTPFRTVAGDPAHLAPSLVTVDLTRFAGTIVRLRFAVAQTVQVFNGGVDDVQLVSTPLRCLSLECPAEIIVSNDPGQCGAIVNYARPVALDACGGGTTPLNADEVTIVSDPPSGSVFPVGTTVVRCTATDNLGNTASCSFNVTVSDSESPVISLSPGASLQPNPTAADIEAAFGVASVTDNCSEGLVASASILPEKGTGCARTVTKIWRVTDLFGNSASTAQTLTFLRDTASPVFQSVLGPSAPIPLGSAATISASVVDDCSGVQSVTFRWNDGSQTTVTPDGSSVSATHTYANPGIYAVRVIARDSAGNSAEELFQYVVVYDPASGCVTGGGWFDSAPGAFTRDSSLVGKAMFGFVCKYSNGSTVPTGQTQFHLRNGDVKFHSSGYEWLVLSGDKAQFKGRGTLNGVAGYEFLLTTADARLSGYEGADRFRLKVWNSQGIVYDSGLGAPDEIGSVDPQAISHGSI